MQTLSRESGTKVHGSVSPDKKPKQNRNMNAILALILDASNDIDAYLGSDVPLECYREDVDKKLRQLYTDVSDILAESTPDHES